MRVLGLGAGGGINDEDAGLAAGSIGGLGDGGGARFGAGFALAVSRFGDGTSLLSILWTSPLPRENEGTASFGWVALDLGVDSSCSTSPVSTGSDSWNEGVPSPSFFGTSSSSGLTRCFTGKMPCALDRSHGGKALRVASGWR
jgi:hypothetical protein